MEVGSECDADIQPAQSEVSVLRGTALGTQAGASAAATVGAGTGGDDDAGVRCDVGTGVGAARGGGLATEALWGGSLGRIGSGLSKG